MGDGVSISDDGNRWHTVVNSFQLPFGWERVTVDLAAEAAAAGIRGYTYPTIFGAAVMFFLKGKVIGPRSNSA